jgi:hypothetical protein
MKHECLDAGPRPRTLAWDNAVPSDSRTVYGVQRYSVEELLMAHTMWFGISHMQENIWGGW